MRATENTQEKIKGAKNSPFYSLLIYKENKEIEQATFNTYKKAFIAYCNILECAPEGVEYIAIKNNKSEIMQESGEMPKLLTIMTYKQFNKLLNNTLKLLIVDKNTTEQEREKDRIFLYNYFINKLNIKIIY